MRKETATFEQVNEFLKLLKKGKTVKEARDLSGSGMVHKFHSILKEMYKGVIPEEVSKTEYMILLGKLREKELDYKKIKEMRKYQKSMNDFFKLR